MINYKKAYYFFQLFHHLVIVIIRLMLSVWVWSKVITLSGFYFLQSYIQLVYLVNVFINYYYQILLGSKSSGKDGDVVGLGLPFSTESEKESE